MDKKEDADKESSHSEIKMEDNGIIMDEATAEIIINNENNNIQLEYFEVNEQEKELIKRSSNVDEEMKSLKKELTYTQEKFSILQSQVLHQAKLIEFLLRLDMLKSIDEPDKKELEDLQRKIHLCSTLIEQSNIKFKELCNEKRRVLIIANNEPVKIEKRSPIWNHFTITQNVDGQKNVECNYCTKSFNYKNMNANKCREHIHDKCQAAPVNVKKSCKPKFDSTDTGIINNKIKCNVWNYFDSEVKNGKPLIICMFCGLEYSSKNATKCREHLAFKCDKIPEETKAEMRSTFSEGYINQFNTTKKSSIWEHFTVIADDDKTVIQCIYCCMNYANKNATKCREHLLERCDKIPLHVRHKISNSLYEIPLRTWTQIKIAIWKHFSVFSHKDQKQYQCNYCKKVYCSKNVTKFRLHLLYKCEKIPDNVKELISVEVNRSSLKMEGDGNEGAFYEDESLQFLNESNEPVDSDEEVNNGNDNEEEEEEEEEESEKLYEEMNDDENKEQKMDEETNERMAKKIKVET